MAALDVPHPARGGEPAGNGHAVLSPGGGCSCQGGDGATGRDVNLDRTPGAAVRREGPIRVQCQSLGRTGDSKSGSQQALRADPRPEVAVAPDP